MVCVKDIEYDSAHIICTNNNNKDIHTLISTLILVGGTEFNEICPAVLLLATAFNGDPTNTNANDAEAAVANALLIAF